MVEYQRSGFDRLQKSNELLRGLSKTLGVDGLQKLQQRNFGKRIEDSLKNRGIISREYWADAIHGIRPCMWETEGNVRRAQAFLALGIVRVLSRSDRSKLPCRHLREEEKDHRKPLATHGLPNIFEQSIFRFRRKELIG